MMELATAENRWVNTVDSQKPEVLVTAREILQNNIYCTLSTCSPEGQPWVSPVFFAYDAEWNLYWSSAIAAEHSQNLAHNHGQVAIAIFDSKGPEGTVRGLYLMGTAGELNRDRVESVMTLLMTRAGKAVYRTPADYLDESPRRIYHFQPQKAWITGDRVAIGNQLVDTKIAINVGDLKQLA